VPAHACRPGPDGAPRHPEDPVRGRGVAARQASDGIVERLVVEDDRLRAVELDGRRTVARDALLIRPALHAHPNPPAAMLGCESVAWVVRTFVLATIAVPIVIYGLMPHLHRGRGRLLARRR
jgi:hypothetical protein